MDGVFFSACKLNCWLIKIAKYWQQKGQNIKFMLSSLSTRLLLGMSRPSGKHSLGAAFEISPSCSAVDDPLKWAQDIAKVALLRHPSCHSIWGREHTSTCHQAGCSQWVAYSCCKEPLGWRRSTSCLCLLQKQVFCKWYRHHH